MLDGGVCLRTRKRHRKGFISHNILSGVSLCENSVSYDGVIKWTNLKTHEEIKGSKRMIFGLAKCYFS